MIASILVSLCPVFIFLLFLVIFDSYKLLKLSLLLKVILFGCIAAAASFCIEYLIEIIFHTHVTTLSIYIAPPIEELFKATIVIIFFYEKRIGFLVDAAIIGFAVGAGFSFIENSYYLSILNHETIFTWVLRGFGTAVMHGSTTCLMAIISGYIIEKNNYTHIKFFLPGILVAMLFHLSFNLFTLPLILMTVLLIAVFSIVIFVIFQQSERGLEKWLDTGLASDISLLRSLQEGRFKESKAGKYLYSLQEILPKEIVGDMLCFLSLHLELAVRAKALLMLRETGYAIEIDPAIQEKFSEMKYLEKTIGRSGLAALKPLLHYSDKDLWQIYFLKSSHNT